MDSIVIDREYACSVDDLWGAWTEPSGLAKWLCSRAEVELEVGGKFELSWDEPVEGAGPHPSPRIKAFEEEYSFTADWAGTGKYSSLLAGPDARTEIVVRFQALGPNRCRLHFVHQGWGDSPEWAEARTWQQSFWEEALLKLKGLLEPGSG